MSAQSIYDFKINRLHGGTLNLSDYKGKTILIVNTASECGYTPQYKGLEELYKMMTGKNFVIIGFPANEFGGQEPGSNEEISSFCERNYGITFPMSQKVIVKGEGIDPLFKYLTDEAVKLGITDPIKWNFTKFLINKDGKLQAVYPSKVDPLSSDIIDAIRGK
ncbi:MAG: glutathione peroxidase [Saprospiraceae bacterium]|nr:glutathione peroxidase [Saprospiraceae bacterium]